MVPKLRRRRFELLQPVEAFKRSGDRPQQLRQLRRAGVQGTPGRVGRTI